jgi:hypothetical protein
VIDWKLPRRMRWRVSVEKKVSTAFSHEPDVGVKWNRRTACLVAQQPVHALLGKPLLPAPDHRSADAKLLGDLLHRTIVSGGEHDVGSLNMLVRAVPIRGNRQ